MCVVLPLPWKSCDVMWYLPTLTVKTACDLLERWFIRVAPVTLAALPASSQPRASSTHLTSSSRQPITTMCVCVCVCVCRPEITGGHWPFFMQFSIIATQNLIMIVSNCVQMANQNFSLASQTQALFSALLCVCYFTMVNIYHQ